MIRSRRAWMLVAAAGSAAVLLGALAFQSIGGLAPCPLCIWQRWPHAVAAVAGVLGASVLARLARPLATLGGLAMLTGAGIGVYHTGIQRGWWPGPATCSAPGNVGDLSTDELMGRIMSAPLVRCDEVAWQMLGLSIPSWNALASLALAVVWFAVAAGWPGQRSPRQDSSSASQ